MMLYCMQWLSANTQSKFGDILIIFSRTTCDKADAVLFGKAYIFTIFGIKTSTK